MKKSGEQQLLCHCESCERRRAAARRGWENRRRAQEKLEAICSSVEFKVSRLKGAQRKVEENQRDFRHLDDIAAAALAPSGWFGLSNVALGLAAPVCARWDVLNPFHN